MMVMLPPDRNAMPRKYPVLPSLAVKGTQGMRRAFAVAPVLLGAIVIAGCGNGGGSSNVKAKVKVADLPSGVVVTVGDGKITQTDLDRAMAQQVAYQKQSGQAPPASGSTAEKDLRRQVVEQLVLQRLIDGEAKICGKPCEVSDAQVDTALNQFKTLKFKGKNADAQLTKYLADLNYTLADARRELRQRDVQTKLYERVTRPIRFTDADAQRYYTANKAQYTTPAGRHVLHILVATKALATKIRSQVTASNFAALSTKYSTDRTAKLRGGDLGVLQRNLFVPEFEKAAFALKDGQTSAPVKTQFGWHVIRVENRPKRVTPFATVKAEIVRTQLGLKQQAAFTKWRDATIAKWQKRSTYSSIDLVPQSQLVTPVATTSGPRPTTTAAGTPPAAP